MGDDRNPDRHTTRDSGEHGNVSFGLARLEVTLRKGEDFSGTALALYRQTLADWGYTELDLSGVKGDFIRMTGQERTFHHMVDAAKDIAAKSGDVAGYLRLEQRYGRRRDKVAKNMLIILVWQEEEAQAIDGDYERILEVDGDG